MPLLGFQMEFKCKVDAVAPKHKISCRSQIGRRVNGFVFRRRVIEVSEYLLRCPFSGWLPCLGWVSRRFIRSVMKQADVSAERRRLYIKIRLFCLRLAHQAAALFSHNLSN